MRLQKQQEIIKTKEGKEGGESQETHETEDYNYIKHVRLSTEEKKYKTEDNT